MQIKTSLALKLSLSTIISLGLISCGSGSTGSSSSSSGSGSSSSGSGSSGGSSSSSSGGSGSSSGGMASSSGGGTGTGGCVTFPRPVVGQIVKRELKGSGVTITTDTEITAISNTSITQRITGMATGGLGGDSTLTEEFTIANNFRDITKDTVSLVGLGFNFVTNYTPFQRVAVDEVCEGQTWTTTYTEKETNEPAITHTQTYTIEAINISRTSPAGIFNTFRVRLEDTNTELSTISATWIDINSGYDVFSEFSDISGQSQGTLELIEKNF